MENLEYKNKMIETQSIEQTFDFNVVFDQQDENTNETEPEDDFPQDIILQDSGIICYSSRGSHKQNYDKFDYIVKEDYIMAAVYDGHGSSTVSLYLKQNLLKNIQLHEKFREDPVTSIYESIKQLQLESLSKFEKTSGSTLIVVLWKKDRLIVANVGDGFCYGFQQNQQFLFQQSETQMKNKKVLLNQIHNLQRQQERNNIKKSGGTIFKSKNSYRVAGQLSLSRSIGDSKYKQWISAIPSIKVYNHRFSEIILATDGLAKFIQPIRKAEEILNLVEGVSCLKDNSTLLYISKPTHYG